MAGLAMLLAVVVHFVATTAAQSQKFPTNSTSANNTSFSPGNITRAPTSLPSSSITANASCSTCVIAVDAEGLQQIFWYTSTWSVTLDTEYITVTTFNGSNATGVSNTRTILGNLSTIITANAPYVSELVELNRQDNGYFDPEAILVRGTDGRIGTTSFPYGQAFAQATAVEYRSIIPDGSHGECPFNMIKYGTACSCVLNQWFPPFIITQYYSSSSYDLKATYYQPVPSSAINMGNAGGQDDVYPLKPWDGEAFSAWLDGNEALNSQLPNWRECGYWNTAHGPPRVIVPVSALTATVVTTVPGPTGSSSPTPRPSIAPSVTMAHSTAQPSPDPSNSGSEGSPGGSKGGGSSSSSSSGDNSSGTNGGSGSDNSGDSGVGGLIGSTSESGPHESSGKGGDPGSTGLSIGSGSQDGDISGNTGSTGSVGSHGSIGSSETSGHTGSSGNTESGNQGGGNAVDFGSSGSGFGSGFNSDSSGWSNYGPGSGSSNPPVSSNYGSGGGSPGSENSSPTAPFVVSAEGHIISGTVQGSTAVVIAGTTITARKAPSAAGGVLISLPLGASSIAVNGKLQPLPTAEPAPGAVAPPIAIATVGDQTITASLGASEVYYAGTVLSQNGPHATIRGTEVYVGPSGLVVGDSSTVALPSAPSSGLNDETEPGVVTFMAAGQTFTSSPFGIVVASATIRSGSTAVISGTTISYGPSGLVIGTSTIPIPTPAPLSAPGSGSSRIFTLGGETFTANPTAISIDGTILTANGPAITVSGTSISLNPVAGLVIASSTYAIPPSALPSSTTVINGQTFTLNPTAIAISGTLLTEGGSAITIHGTPISLGPSGLVIAGTTVPYPNSPFTDAIQTSEGLGAAILAGFGPSTATSSATGCSGTNSPATFEGAAAKGKSISLWERGSMFVALIGGLIIGGL